MPSAILRPARFSEFAVATRARGPVQAALTPTWSPLRIKTLPIFPIAIVSRPVVFCAVEAGYYALKGRQRVFAQRADSTGATILNEISFEPEIERLLKDVRDRGPKRVVEEVEGLIAAATGIGAPKALYRLAFVEQKGDDRVIIAGVELKSRVLRVNLDNAHRVFAYAATCGRELDEWAKSFDDLLQRYWADKINEMALRAAIRTLREHLVDHYQLGRISTMSPGSLEDWPIEEQRPLFGILGDTETAIGVRLTDSFLMIPTKSVSGIVFPTEVRFESCQLCPRQNCPGRRAEYDKDLYDRKYRKK